MVLATVSYRESKFNIVHQTVPRGHNQNNRLDCASWACTKITRTSIYPITIRSILALDAVLICTMEVESSWDDIWSSRSRSQASRHDRQALTLDCGNHWPGGPVNQKIHWPPKKPTGPPKTCNDPNVFAAGIYDFTREVAPFCTLGLYITKNKYELTLPSEFCRFPVKIMAAYEALKKKN